MAKSDTTSPAGEELNAQIAALKADIAGLTEAVRGLAKSKITETAGAAREELGDLIERGQKAGQQLRESAGKTAGSIEHAIEERPVAAVLAALAIGFVIGSMSHR